MIMKTQDASLNMVLGWAILRPGLIFQAENPSNIEQSETDLMLARYIQSLIEERSVNNLCQISSV